MEERRRGRPMLASAFLWLYGWCAAPARGLRADRSQSKRSASEAPASLSLLWVSFWASPIFCLSLSPYFFLLSLSLSFSSLAAALSSVDANSLASAQLVAIAGLDEAMRRGLIQAPLREVFALLFCSSESPVFAKRALKCKALCCLKTCMLCSTAKCLLSSRNKVLRRTGLHHQRHRPSAAGCRLYCYSLAMPSGRA